MKTIMIDTSKEYVAIIIGEESILKILNYRLRKAFGKTVHMRELKLSEKLSVLRTFNRLFSERAVKLYSLKPKANSWWWTELIKAVIKRRISTLYVDLEVYQELRRKVHPLYLKPLNIYPSKEKTQCADILAYGNSHRKLVRNIWKELSIERGES